MSLDELDRFANNLARPSVIILIVETVNALGVIGKIKCYVFANRLVDETVNRIIHSRNFIASGASYEHRRNFIRILFKVSYGRKSLDGFRRFGLLVV